MKPPTPESALVREIRLALGRESDLVLWRLTQGATRTEDGRWIRYGLVPGAADLIGVGPRGLWLSLEVKSARGRQSEEQIAWGALVRARGGIYAVVRSVDEARAAIEEARRR